MGNEAAKAYSRLKSLLTGRILDIGGGSGKICEEAEVYDLAQGDAQYLPNVQEESYDTIFSSHCLEHLKDPSSALHAWWKVLKIGGLLILLVPDEDLYERGIWPSSKNGDHKVSFTASKEYSWCPQSHNITDMIRALPGHKLWSLRIVDTNFDYTKPAHVDQSQDSNIECCVEMVLEKRKSIRPSSQNFPLQEIECSKCTKKFFAFNDDIGICSICKFGS